MKRPAVVTLAGAALAVAALAGCSSAFSHAASPAASPKATASAQDQNQSSCMAQLAWNLNNSAAVKALYADTGALAADERAQNSPGVTKAGRKLASDAIAAATLPLPPMASGSWKTLTADYAAAGSAIAGGDVASAVPQLEAGSEAITAFSAATGKCTAAKA
jgi:hypothetical protein